MTRKELQAAIGKRVEIRESAVGLAQPWMAERLRGTLLAVDEDRMGTPLHRVDVEGPTYGGIRWFTSREIRKVLPS
jgi:hypothetical protein